MAHLLASESMFPPASRPTATPVFPAAVCLPTLLQGHPPESDGVVRNTGRGRFVPGPGGADGLRLSP